MMNRWILHPPVFAIGEAESKYARRGDGGWLLLKRGILLDRYHWSRAVSRQFRVEIGGRSPKSADWEWMCCRCEDYRQAGWREVPSRGMVHVFTAPIGCPEPYLYEDPYAQRYTVRTLRNRGRLCSILAALLICALAVGIGLLFTKTVSTVTALWLLLLIDHPAQGLLVLTLALWCIGMLLRAGICNLHLARRIRKGMGIRHGTAHLRGKQMLVLMMAGLCVIFAACIGIQKLQEKTETLPREADGDYLLLEDLGVTGKRLVYASGEELSTCLHEKSLLGDHWETEERITSGTQRITLQQFTYRLAFRSLTSNVADALLESRGISQKKDYQRLQIDGLDAAWAGAMDCVAIRGNVVYYVRYLAFDGKDAVTPVLEALAAQ